MMTYSQFVSVVSKDLFRAIKNNKEEYDNFIAFWDDDRELVISFKINRYKNLVRNFYIQAESSDNEIEGLIELNPLRVPESYNELLAEIKETLRHEIEHVCQFTNKNKEQYERFISVPFYRYLMLRHEVPAYVRGLYTRAKTEKKPLKEVIEHHFKMYNNHFQNEDEINEVRSVWYDYATNNKLLTIRKIL